MTKKVMITLRTIAIMSNPHVYMTYRLMMKGAGGSMVTEIAEIVTDS